MTIEIDSECTTLLSSDYFKVESLYAGPFINAEFSKGEKTGTENWILEVICFLKVPPLSQTIDLSKYIRIQAAEGYLMMDILPMKGISIEKIADYRCDKNYLWYIKTKPFELDELYNVLEVSIDDDLSAGKRRGGRTVGIYTALSKL